MKRPRGAASFGLAMLLGLFASHASATDITVLGTDVFVPRATGVFGVGGDSFELSAVGAVDIATSDGPYITDADGTILTAPPPGSGASGYFTTVSPVGTIPVAGIKKFDPNGDPFGSLLFAFSSSGAPSTAAFLYVGHAGLITAPAGGGQIFFAVADVNDYDNAGSFQVTLTAVPEPGSGKLMLAGAVGLLLALRRRRHGGSGRIHPPIR